MKDDLDRILAFRDARDWAQYHTPKNVAISLALETAEVLEAFQWTDRHDLPDGKRDYLAKELADVYYYLLLLTHETGIDLRAAFLAKMEENTRKYPVEEFRGSARKYNEREDGR